MSTFEIIQGSNSPLVLPINTDSESAYNVRVGLYGKEGAVKLWRGDDVTVSNGYVSCPLTSQETAEFSLEKLEVYVKWSDSAGTICFAKPVPVYVRKRRDKNVT